MIEINTQELADTLGVTTRRVRQLDEDGYFIRIAPGKYLASQAMSAHLALRSIDRKHRESADVIVLTALGWLLALDQVGPAELSRWSKMTKRLGFTKRERDTALSNAVRILGNRAPEFT